MAAHRWRRLNPGYYRTRDERFEIRRRLHVEWVCYPTAPEVDHIPTTIWGTLNEARRSVAAHDGIDIPPVSKPRHRCAICNYPIVRRRGRPDWQHIHTEHGAGGHQDHAPYPPDTDALPRPADRNLSANPDYHKLLRNAKDTHRRRLKKERDNDVDR